MKKLHERAEWWRSCWETCANLDSAGHTYRDYSALAIYCHKRYLIVLQQIKDAQ